MPGEAVIKRLVKCLELTASDHDGEALAATRKANDIRKSLNLMWADLLEGGGHPANVKPLERYEEMFAHIWQFNPPSGKWKSIIRDLESFAKDRGYLTSKQERLVRKFYDEATERMRDRDAA